MKQIIFDFDGTLADSLPLMIEIADEMVGHHIVLSPELVAELRNMPAKDAIKYSGIPYIKIPRLLIRGRALLAKRIDKLNVFNGLAEVVRKLHDDGHALYVVSSNTEANIRAVLQRSNIDECFTAIHGGVGLFSKAAAIKKFMKLHGIDQANCLYVGDEVRDIEAAKKVHVPVVSVAWGLNGEQILTAYHPDYLVKTPAQLAKVLNQEA